MLKIERDKVYLDGRGKRFRIVCVDRTWGAAQFPVIGVSEDGNIYTYTTEGKYDPSSSSSSRDLIREVEEKKVLYLNLYPNNATFGIYASKQQADDCASKFRIACIRVEYEEGQFDD